MARLTWDELLHWIAFDRVEPMFEPWIASGKLISLIASFGGKEPVKLSDVYPWLAAPPPDARVLAARAQVFAAANNRRYAGRTPSH